MNVYIMFCFIENIGGGENYVDSKVKYLQQNNWKVVVFSPKTGKKQHSPWANLEQFFDNRREELGYAPEFWPKKTMERTIEWMVDIVGHNKGHIIIESHTDFFAEWGEILAKKLNAKHICFLLDERLEFYSAKEFLYFKYLRGELAYIHKNSFQRLFQNYKELELKNSSVLVAAHYDSVRDVENVKINNLTKMDWDIAYVGRNKQYVRNILEGVKKFASTHKDKQIHFVVLGDIGENIKMPENLHVELLGFMRPIPKAFFEHMDVVIAGAGCARIAQAAGVLTIVADAGTCMSAGLLGYTTEDSLFGSGLQESFDVALENVLVKKIWENIPYNSHQNRSDEEVEQCYIDHFRFIERSNQTKEYFDFQKYPQKHCSKILSLKSYIRCYMRIYIPGLFFLIQKVVRVVRGKISNVER